MHTNKSILELHYKFILAASKIKVLLLIPIICLVGCGDIKDNNSPSEVVSSEGAASLPRGSDRAEGGGIDVEGGYTQEEQIAELQIVVEVMQDHFGDDVATIDSDPWTAERHDSRLAPLSEERNLHRHAINFNIPPMDLSELYDIGIDISEELGLTTYSRYNNNGEENRELFFSAGLEEGRTFLIKGNSSRQKYSATYETRRSDDSSLREAYERIAETRGREADRDRPLQMEDIEGESGHE